MTVYICKNIGVDGTTKVHLKKEDGLYIARIGFSLFGQTNMSEEQFEACGYNPFHKDFFDNYAEGKGSSEKEAIELMKNKLAGISSSLWDE